MPPSATVTNARDANTRRSILVLDLSKFLEGGEKEQENFCKDLIDAFRHEGFAKLKNHGIDEKSIQQVFEQNQQFFELSLEQKNKAAHPAQPNPHRGYSFVGQEVLSMVKDYEKGNRDAVPILDIKESFDQGSAEDTLYPNRWPDENDIPGFRSFMESFYEKCHSVHLNLLRAISIGLGCPSTYLVNLCGFNTSELRLNHYPACSTARIRDGAMRISEHTDFGTVTLLLQDSQGGLEIEDQQRRGTYFPVEAKDQCEMIVNIGDCLQRWTGNLLRSTSHRVTVPPHAGEWLNSRYSVAYFAKPNRDQSVGVLPELRAGASEVQYDNVTAWQYNQRKLNRTYAA